MEKEFCMKELTRLLEETARYIKLYQNKSEKFSGNDFKVFKEIIAAEYDIISDIEPKDEDVEKILGGISELTAAADAHDFNSLMKNYQSLSDIKLKYDQEKLKINKLMEVFHIDLREMELHDMKLKTLQEAVSMDLKMYGEVTKVTLEVLDVQHCEVVNNLVQEKTAQEIDAEEKAGDKKLPADKNIQENPAVSDMKAGDIIKLKLPRLEAGQKREVENMLFQAGARYHKYIIPAEKSNIHKEIRGKNWYVKIAEGMNLKPFVPYISEVIFHNQKPGPAATDEKGSVLWKLSQNKTKVEAGQKGAVDSVKVNPADKERGLE